MAEKENLTKQDFELNEPVKWCPGCGGHAILASLQNALPAVSGSKENVVFVSGIGCSSRLPYYINTYGFHTLHGRATAVASGIKTANPNLCVWVVAGDGDLMAIGGNHFIHLLRRNININIILFNNKIYGLTKGQYSPTTPKGSITKTSPDGTIENPFKPGELAMGAQGTFYARVVDTEPNMMKEVFIQAAKHKGTSLVEVLQNCVIFNNKIHTEITGKDVKENNQIYLEHGKPMIFGKNRDKGLIIHNSKIIVVNIGEQGVTEEDVAIHNTHSPDDTTHYMLTRMTLPDYPVAMGIIRAYQSTVYESVLHHQIEEAKKNTEIKTVEDLFNSGNVFEVN
ncbi:MAG: 2-oxoacid:ferredoxin oxidoreductase subunit beta [Bacteroidales bacterium]|nr:2-oxoacid:ferredoxin oxidoreductase subunit beta [Bacteroidales bacterium]